MVSFKQTSITALLAATISQAVPVLRDPVDTPADEAGYPADANDWQPSALGTKVEDRAPNHYSAINGDSRIYVPGLGSHSYRRDAEDEPTAVEVRAPHHSSAAIKGTRPQPQFLGRRTYRYKRDVEGSENEEPTAVEIRAPHQSSEIKEIRPKPLVPRPGYRSYRRDVEASEYQEPTAVEARAPHHSSATRPKPQAPRPGTPPSYLWTQCGGY